MQWRALSLLAVFACGCASVDTANSRRAPRNDRAPVVRPTSLACDDFYEYACAEWMNANPIPEDHAAWYRSFNVIAEDNDNMLRAILERNASAPPADEPHARALGDFYASCMDIDTLEERGDAELRVELSRLDAIKDGRSFAKALGEIHARGERALFQISVGRDFMDAGQVIAIAKQGGLGLPDRDYYFASDATSQRIRDRYTAHIAEMLRLSGHTLEAANAGARAVLRVESHLARVTTARIEEQRPNENYHRIDLAGLKRLAPNFAWEVYSRELGIPQVATINVAHPEFFRAVGEAARAMKGEAISDWKTYLRWHIIHGNAQALPSRFTKEDFAFQTVLTGTAQMPPRWKRCLRATEAALGDALAQRFVKMRLGVASKARALQLVGVVEEAMRANLETLPWLDPTTRQGALQKLSLVRAKVAHPEVWRTYEGLEIQRNSFFGNTLRAAGVETKRQLSKIGKAAELDDFPLIPTAVNANYDLSRNEISIAAGILTFPFLSEKTSLATDFGALGVVIGHELTHGFDERGRQFDGRGNMREWWSKPVSEEFNRRAGCLAAQFDDYEVDGIRLNGKLTLGENMADLAGIKLAYAAFQTMREGKAIPHADPAYTPEQDFFLSYARVWCGSIRKEKLRLMMTTDPLFIPRFRVNGPLSNLPEFAQAFSCREGSPMARPAAQRCEIW